MKTEPDCTTQTDLFDPLGSDNDSEDRWLWLSSDFSPRSNSSDDHAQSSRESTSSSSYQVDVRVLYRAVDAGSECESMCDIDEEEDIKASASPVGNKGSTWAAAVKSTKLGVVLGKMESPNTLKERSLPYPATMPVGGLRRCCTWRRLRAACSLALCAVCAVALILIAVGCVVGYSFVSCPPVPLPSMSHPSPSERRVLEVEYERLYAKMNPGRRHLEAHHTIDKQMHSHNHLEEWPALWRKGVRHLKIDPHYVSDVDLCRKIHGDRRPVGENGCLVLSHNYPDPAQHHNTLDDVFEHLAHQDVMERRLMVLDSRVTITLCLKRRPEEVPCTPFGYAGWVHLMDDFYDKANRLILDNSLNMEFILDGGAMPCGCTAERWRPWNATWLGTPHGAYSDDEWSLHNRYQKLNHQAGREEWTKMAAEGFGKFASPENRYAIQVYHTNEETDMNMYAQLYLGSGVDKRQGFHFAMDDDPVSFEIKMGPVTGRAVNRAGGTLAGRPVVTALPRSQGGPPRVITFSSGMKGVNEYTITAIGKLGDASSIETPSVLPGVPDNDAVVSAAAVTIEDENAGSVVITQGGLVAFIATHVEGGSLRSGCRQPSPLGNRNSGHLRAIFNPSSQSNTIGIVTSCCIGPGECSCEGVVAGCAIAVEFVAVSLGSDGCVAASPTAHKPQCLLSADAEMLVTNLHADAVLVNDELQGTLGWEWKDAQSGTTYIGLATFDWEGSTARHSRALAGNTPSISVTALSGQAVFSVVAGGGFCYYPLLNHDDACTAKPWNHDTVLTYTNGRWSQLEAYLRQMSESPNSLPIGPCATSLNHGMFHQGRRPSGVLVPVDTAYPTVYDNNGSGLAIFVEHEGLDSPGIWACGAVVPHPNRLVREVWPILEF